MGRVICRHSQNCLLVSAPLHPPLPLPPQVYDVRTHRELGSYKGHTREVTSCAWHPVHEELFSSASPDGNLMHWLVSRPESQAQIPGAHEREVRGEEPRDHEGGALPVRRIMESIGIAHSHFVRKGLGFILLCVGPLQVWALQWHPIGHVLVSGGQDQHLKLWARARPGDLFPSAGEEGGDGSRRGDGGWGAESSGPAGPSAFGVGGAAGGGGVAASIPGISAPTVIPGIGVPAVIPGIGAVLPVGGPRPIPAAAAALAPPPRPGSPRGGWERGRERGEEGRRVGGMGGRGGDRDPKRQRWEGGERGPTDERWGGPPDERRGGPMPLQHGQGQSPWGQQHPGGLPPPPHGPGGGPWGGPPGGGPGGQYGGGPAYGGPHQGRPAGGGRQGGGKGRGADRGRGRR